jgi:MFS family permease
VSRRTAVVVVTCAAQALVGADGLSVTIALPAIQDEFGVAPIDGQWVISAYALAFGGTLLLAGRLGDLYGRRRLLTYGMGVFTAGAIAAALAPALEALVAARAVQGLGAAASIPASLALIGAVIPPGKERTHALSLLAAMASVGVISGLVLGGVVTQLLGWRWVFAVLAVPALAAAVVAPRLVPETRAERTDARLDVPGAILITAAMLTLLFGLTRAARGAGAATTVQVISAGGALLACFVAWEANARDPLIRAGLLRVRSLRAATIGAAANAVAFTAIVYIGTLYLQRALGYTPIQAGIALAPLDLTAFIVPLLAAGRLARIPPRAVLVPAFAVTALSLAWLARAPIPASYAGDLLVALVALGASLSIAFVVLTNQAVADVDGDEKGAASGVFETANHLLGGAFGAALYATVLAASGYRAAFLVAAALAGFGLVAAQQAAGRPVSRSRGTG